MADSPFTSTLPTAASAAYGGAVPTATFASTIGTILTFVFSVLGVIFLLLTIYAGILWMTAAGDPKKVQKAKDILAQSVIGLIICVAAYGFSYTILAWGMVSVVG